MYYDRCRRDGASTALLLGIVVTSCAAERPTTPAPMADGPVVVQEPVAFDVQTECSGRFDGESVFVDCNEEVDPQCEVLATAHLRGPETVEQLWGCREDLGPSDGRRVLRFLVVTSGREILWHADTDGVSEFQNVELKDIVSEQESAARQEIVLNEVGEGEWVRFVRWQGDGFEPIFNVTTSDYDPCSRDYRFVGDGPTYTVEVVLTDLTGTTPPVLATYVWSEEGGSFVGDALPCPDAAIQAAFAAEGGAP
jgi:hypothetical protein